MKYLIFDFDGVLGDTYEASIYAREKFEHMTREEAIRDWTVHFCRAPRSRESGLAPEEIANQQAWLDSFCRYVNEHGFELFTDFIKEIAQIKDAKLAIVSSGSINYLKPKIDACGLPFTHVLAFEDGHSKEEKVERVCRDWNIPVSDAYYFTDAVSDVLELETIMDKNKIYGCAWGFLGYEKLLTALPADHIFREYADIRKIA